MDWVYFFLSFLQKKKKLKISLFFFFDSVLKIFLRISIILKKFSDIEKFLIRPFISHQLYPNW